MTLKLELDPETWPILSDASQLENALLNLVFNARDASADTGCILIKVENVQAPVDIADIPPALRQEGLVRISVRDWGTGIPKSIIDKIVEPFFTTKDVGKGTGLGLSTVQGFTRHFEGSMQVESEPGQGTTVSLYFPRLPGTEETAPPPHSQAMLLVVDDDN